MRRGILENLRKQQFRRLEMYGIAEMWRWEELVKEMQAQRNEELAAAYADGFADGKLAALKDIHAAGYEGEDYE